MGVCCSAKGGWTSGHMKFGQILLLVLFATTSWKNGPIGRNVGGDCELEEVA